jgi:hypothetical protein
MKYNPVDSETIEAIIAQDPGDRKVASLVVTGDLQRAAEQVQKASSCWIVTGFVIPSVGMGETDGPAGAIALARGLDQLGIPCSIVSDEINLALMGRAGYPHLCSVEQAIDGPVASLGIVIERPGPASDGKFYTMAGEEMTDHVRDVFDHLFVPSQMRGTRWVGIGDGGNEIGMGKVRDRVIKHVPRGEKIASVASTSELIVAGTSNSGAWGLLAELSLQTSRDLLPTPAQAWQDVIDLVAAGACDGRTGKRQASVDGLTHEVYLAPLVAMRRLLVAVACRQKPTDLLEENPL